MKACISGLACGAALLAAFAILLFPVQRSWHIGKFSLEYPAFDPIWRADLAQVDWFLLAVEVAISAVIGALVAIGVSEHRRKRGNV